MAGRVLSGKNEAKLRDALAALSEVLAQLDSGDEASSVRGLTGGFEQRTVALGGVEVRGADGTPVIAGYAAVFNRLSQPLYNFREQIAPGAFKASLAGDVRALWQHDTSRVLGRTTNGTLKLWEDERGLAFELAPPETQDGRDAVALIGRGDVDQMSFGFVVPTGGDSWTEDRSAMPTRTLNTVKLIEVSPVTFSAYLDTTASVLRNAPEWVRRALLPGGVVHEVGALPHHTDIPTDDSEAARARDLLRRRLALLSI